MFACNQRTLIFGLPAAGAPVAAVARSTDQIAETVTLIEAGGGTANGRRGAREARADRPRDQQRRLRRSCAARFCAAGRSCLRWWRRGRVINVASGAGARGIPYMSACVTSKAALIRFSETLATALKNSGVSVFAIQPGTVRTAMAEDLLNSEEKLRWLP
jgi:NAD(P)-dependent dehydrogenase (short-subunit alcohol dehydrogenase family)